MLAGASRENAKQGCAKRSTIILTNIEGKPWTSDGFRTSLEVFVEAYLATHQKL